MMLANRTSKRTLAGFLALCGALAATAGAAMSDDAQLLELHQKVLEAHLASDIEILLTDETDADYIVVSRGEISKPDKQARRERLGPYLKATEFEVYEDQVPPVVRVSEDGTLGWVIVQVHALGAQTTSEGKTGTLEFVSGWIELYEKRDGRWLRTGNVSNFKG